MIEPDHRCEPIARVLPGERSRPRQDHPPRVWSLIAGRVALSLCVVAPSLGHCQIYVGTSEESGSLVLSSFASPEARTVLIAESAAATGAALGSGAPIRRTVALRPAQPVSDDLLRIIEAAAARESLSPELIHAVIESESRYRTSAVSPRGAIGLMQLLPATAKRFGAQDPFDPRQNVAAGSAYLKWLMSYFNEDLELVLAGYNAGEQAVIRAGRKVPPYEETRAYVKKVMAALERLRPPVL
jgi:soluble lytic murein transglycosylase-like protein